MTTTSRRATPMLLFRFSAFLAVASSMLAGRPGSAGSPERWEARFGGRQLRLATVVGMSPLAEDGWDGSLPWLPAQDESGVFVMVHREHGTAWAGPTGFYGGDFERTPIPPGGSKTWWDFYLWAQNWTLEPPGQVQVETSYETAYERPPDGYVGQLVLDYVPPSCNWTGPTELWLDLTQWNTITLPAATVTDPLQGTRFHLTVYAIPEPAGLLALGVCLAALASAVVRRRR